MAYPCKGCPREYGCSGKGCLDWESWAALTWAHIRRQAFPAQRDMRLRTASTRWRLGEDTGAHRRPGDYRMRRETH